MAGYEGYTSAQFGTTGNVTTYPTPLVWSSWVDGTTTTANSSTVWGNWIVDTSASTTGQFDTNHVWSTWTVGTFTISPDSAVTIPPFSQTSGFRSHQESTYGVTPKPARKGRIVSRQAFQEERERRQRSERGLDLLRFLLKPKQLRELRGMGSVRIEGSMGGLYEFGLANPSIMYKIGPDGKAVQKYGICQTAVGYCAEDRVAAAILAFQSDEAAALKLAMVHAFGHEHEPVRVQKRRVFRELVA